MNAILEQLKQYFDNTPRDIIKEEWNEFCSYDDIGPTIDEFLSFTNERSFKWKNILEETVKIEKTPNLYSEFFLFLQKIIH
jgi:hypothetical protein